jgi:ankyrin repeat protein
MDAVYGLSLASSTLKRQTNKTNKITERQGNRTEWLQKGLTSIRSDRHTTTADAEVIGSKLCVNERKLTPVVNQDTLQQKSTHMGSISIKGQRAISTNNFALLQELIEKNNNSLTRNNLYFNYKGKIVKTSLLGYACSCGNLSAVKYLIRQQANVNAMDAEGYTPLHRAASNSKEIVKYLLKSGADPKIVSANGRSVNALGAALMTSHTQIDESLRQTKIAKALLKFDNKLLSEPCYKTFYPLEAVDQLKFLGVASTIMEIYRKQKIDIPGNMHLYSLLHSTCATDKLKDVKYQVDRKKKELSKCEFTSYINQTYRGKTPLHLACNHKNKDIIKYLLKNGADIYQPDFNGLTVLETLLKNGSSIEYCKLIIDKMPKKDLDKPLFNGSSALSLAIKYSNNDLSYLLISKRTDLHRKYLESEGSCLENSTPVTDTAVTMTPKKITFGYVERRNLETGEQLDSIKLI